MKLVLSEDLDSPSPSVLLQRRKFDFQLRTGIPPHSVSRSEKINATFSAYPKVYNVDRNMNFKAFFPAVVLKYISRFLASFSNK